MDLEILKHAQEYIEKMANGINPLTGKSVPDDDTINNIRISRCLFYVNNVLKEVLVNKGVTKGKKEKIPFNLSEDIINKYDYTDEDLSISAIVRKINDLKTDENMVKLKITEVCNWLVSIGLLVTIETNGKKVKVPTEMGKNMGMYLEHRSGMYEEYDIVLYKKSVQEFIIDNFENLLEYIK